MSRIVAEVAKKLSNADIEIIETHHNQKKDAPSGDITVRPIRPLHPFTKTFIIINLSFLIFYRHTLYC